MNSFFKLLFTLSIVFVSTQIYSQNSKTKEDSIKLKKFVDNPKNIVFTYGKNKVSASEFNKNFRKNDKPNTKYTKESVDDYLKLYSNFRLKVNDAYQKGYDTSSKYQDELLTYRKQIIKPFLLDKVMNDQLINEAYYRMQHEVRASHILILCKSDANAKDTFEAFNKIKTILEDIESKRTTFDQAAQLKSEDPSAADNKGDLGYFSAFQMVYEFENAAFNTPVGTVSKIFRTSYGYHIVKTVDIRKSKGEITCSHIFIQLNPNPSNKELNDANSKINEIYNRLQAGDDYTQMVKKFSEDQQTASKNGEMPSFSMTSYRWTEEFKEVAFALANDGDYSKPIRSQHGFHILKRISLKPIGDLKELKPTILNKINRDSRQYKNSQATYKKASKQMAIKENKKALFSAQNFLKYNNKKYFIDNQNEKFLKQPLITYSKLKKGKKAVILSINDFNTWLNNLEFKELASDVNGFYNKLYEDFKMYKTLSLYEENLETFNDSFAQVFKEYREGILLFYVQDIKIWAKSLEDTTGLKKFYEQNKQKYVFGDRYEATIYRCRNKEIAENIKKDIENGLSTDSIIRKTNKENSLNLANPKIGRFENGDDFYANYIFQSGKKENMDFLMFEDPKSPGSYILIRIHKFIPSIQKTLPEAKGPVTSDYQKYLENEWLEELKKQNPIIINQKVLDAYKNLIVN